LLRVPDVGSVRPPTRVSTSFREPVHFRLGFRAVVARTRPGPSGWPGSSSGDAPPRAGDRAVFGRGAAPLSRCGGSAFRVLETRRGHMSEHIQLELAPNPST